MTVMFGRVNLGASPEQPLSARLNARGNETARGNERARRNKIPGSRGNMCEMIPIFAPQASIIIGLLAASALSNAAAAPGAPVKREPVACLASGDGYLRAKLAGSIDARLDWPNSGTRCEGEFREKPPGVRLSFQRVPGSAPNLLLVFGLTGVKEGAAAHEVKANLTVIVQGTSRIFGTLGDSRCTVDSLTQRPLAAEHSYRVEARGFCTQPAHAVRGKGDVLVSTFEFAGPVLYYEDQKN
jgi:hypothetical protein